MPTPMTVAVMGLAGTAVTGMLLLGASWVDDSEGTKREGLSLENDEVEDGNDDEPTDDKTLDTNPRDSAASRIQPSADGASRGTRTDSVDAALTSGVTRGTVSGGAGTVDAAPTSGVSRTASGGAGTVDGNRGGGGGGDGSRDRSRGSGSRSRG